MTKNAEHITFSFVLALTALPALTGCPDDTTDESETTSDVASDTGATDTGSDTGTATDTGTGTDTTPDTATDTGTATDTTPDTDTDTAIDSDAGGTTTTAAVLGARCELAERVGLFEVSASFGPAPYVSGWVQDKADPWYGEPQLTTSACDFHVMSTIACDPCGEDELCDRSGECVKAPVRHADATLTLTAGEATQVFEADDTTGDMYGDVTLDGTSFALAIAFADQRVTLAATTLPAPVEGVAGTMTGEYDAPEAVDITWTPTAGGGSVYTLIPINHHAAGPTFTECAVDASAGALHVGEDMLVPLAVITGLEFQGIHHHRFAAAATPKGCVEIRFSGGQQFVNLEPANP